MIARLILLSLLFLLSPMVFGWNPTNAVSGLGIQSGNRVTIRATTGVAFEDGSRAGVFVIAREGSTAEALTVQLAITGNATNGADYQRIPKEVQIAAGASSTELRIVPIDDSDVEDDELVTVGLAAAPIARTFDNSLASITIKDNDTVVQIEVSDPNGSETGPRPIVFRISRNGNIRSNLTVRYSVGGTNGGVNTGFGDGSVRTVSDGSVRTVSDGSVRILDGTSNTIGVAETSLVAASASDFVPLPGRITFQPGESSKPLALVPIDDTTAESRESVTVSLQRDSLYTLGKNRSAVGFIDDNDQFVQPIVQVVVVDPNGSESGQKPIVFRITRSANTNAQLTVNYVVNPSLLSSGFADGTSNTIGIGETPVAPAATSGLDFTPLPGSIDFQVGETVKQLNVVPVDDNIQEGRESVRLVLSPSRLYQLGTSRSAFGLIDDNDQVTPVVSIVATQSEAREEGPTNGTFTVSRTGPVTQSLTVSYSVNDASAGNIPNPATNGVDFDQLSGQIVIPVGSAAATITVRPIRDNDHEAEERVVIRLLPSTSQAYTIQSGSNQATVRIKDDHRP